MFAEPGKGRAAAAVAAGERLGGEMGALLEGLVQERHAEAPRQPALLLELVCFGLVGGVAALSFVALSVALVSLETGIPDWIVSAFCYALFIIPVYLAHRRFSFRSDAPHAVALPRYVAVQFSAVTLATIFSYVCYAVLGLNSVLAAGLVIGLTSGVNFAVLKLWAFAHRG